MKKRYKCRVFKLFGRLGLRILLGVPRIQVIKGNKLMINFFKVTPDDSKAIAYIDGVELKDYIKTRLKELMQQA